MKSMNNVNQMTRRENLMANIYTAIIIIVTVSIIAIGAACSADAQEQDAVTTETTAATEQLAAETQTIDATVTALAATSDILPTDDDPPLATTLEAVTATVAATDDSEQATTDTTDTAPRTYNGITEGDTYTGTLSYYDVCLKCCGKTDGITASGLHIWNGMEDPHVCSCNWLPLGTVVSIDGVEYTVADRGGSGLNTIGRIDIFVPAGHQAALNLGRTEGAEIVIISFPEDA